MEDNKSWITIFITILNFVIEKEKFGINRYISRNKQMGNERWNINCGSTKPSQGISQE